MKEIEITICGKSPMRVCCTHACAGLTKPRVVPAGLQNCMFPLAKSLVASNADYWTVFLSTSWQSEKKCYLAALSREEAHPLRNARRASSMSSLQASSCKKQSRQSVCPQHFISGLIASSKSLRGSRMRSIRLQHAQVFRWQSYSAFTTVCLVLSKIEMLMLSAAGQSVGSWWTE